MSISFGSVPISFSSPSSSKSSSVSLLYGSVPSSNSSWSVLPSLSSSSSSVSPIPSLSKSVSLTIKIVLIDADVNWAVPSCTAVILQDPIPFIIILFPLISAISVSLLVYLIAPDLFESGGGIVNSPSFMNLSGILKLDSLVIPCKTVIIFVWLAALNSLFPGWLTLIFNSPISKISKVLPLIKAFVPDTIS